jgi:hypothetical protein
MAMKGSQGLKGWPDAGSNARAESVCSLRDWAAAIERGFCRSRCYARARPMRIFCTSDVPS